MKKELWKMNLLKARSMSMVCALASLISSVEALATGNSQVKACQVSGTVEMGALSLDVNGCWEFEGYSGSAVANKCQSKVQKWHAFAPDKEKAITLDIVYSEACPLAQASCKTVSESGNQLQEFYYDVDVRRLEKYRNKCQSAHGEWQENQMLKSKNES